MYFCVAAKISWALVFAPIPGDSMIGDARGLSCFSDQFACESAAMAANAAFAESMNNGQHAYCEAQPAGDPTTFRSAAPR